MSSRPCDCCDVYLVAMATPKCTRKACTTVSQTRGILCSRTISHLNKYFLYQFCHINRPYVDDYAQVHRQEYLMKIGLVRSRKHIITTLSVLYSTHDLIYEYFQNEMNMSGDTFYVNINIHLPWGMSG